MSQILPDGVTVADLEALDLSKPVTPANAELISIIADLAIKEKVANRREAWIVQARIAEYVKRNRLWAFHPAGFNSITDWARQPEIDIDSGLLSDMIAIVEFAPEFEEAGYDIYQLIRDVGGSKIRKFVPAMREAARFGMLVEQIGPKLEEARGADLNGILEMTNPKGSRVSFDPEVIYEEEEDGTFTISFPGLDLDQLEFLAKKLRIRRWIDSLGQSIEPPILPEHTL